ncbi:MAG: endonuclease III [Clostridia bacterium]|nr:endonuclease III [Clostridia bacterium]
MNKKQKKERLALIVERLKSLYPDAACALEYGGDPWRLLVMGSLSAQCTDKRVNMVSKELFLKYPSAEALADADIFELEEIVKPCGLYRVKAQNIKEASRLLVSEYGGVLPSEMKDLLRFAGVGRKVANLLRGDIHKLPAVVCDTHCMRICARFGMYPVTEKNPTRIEKILCELIEPNESSDFCHRIVLFGRDVCSARNPACDSCALADLCEKRKKELK